jgi:hypothetical protein
MTNLFEVAVLNWVERSKSELRRKTKRFRSSTILEAIFWKSVAEMYGKRFSF